MKILFFGLGSIGQRQAKLIQELYKGQHKLYAFRSGKKKAGNNLGLEEIYEWHDVKVLKPDVAFITNPTSLHVTTAARCAQEGMALFIEKPLGNDITDLKALSKFRKHKKLVTYVAYVLRFHPVVNYFRELAKKNPVLHMRVITTSYLHSWRADKDDRKSYSAHKKMGGGVINDLSHELDFTEYILGPIGKISGQFGRRGQVTVDAEDYADILVQTKKAPANIHINFMSQAEQRIIQMDFKDKFVVGDIINGVITEYKSNRPVKGVKFEGEVGYKVCFQNQLRYFFNNIDNPRMMNNVSEAVPLLKKILELKKKR